MPITKVSKPKRKENLAMDRLGAILKGKIGTESNKA